MSLPNIAQSLEADAKADDFAARLEALRPGSRLTIVGLDSDSLARRLPERAPRLLLLNLSGVFAHEAVIERVLDDLANLALSAWPAWPEPKLASWGRAAGRLAASGLAPRFYRVARETQLNELGHKLITGWRRRPGVIQAPQRSHR